MESPAEPVSRRRHLDAALLVAVCILFSYSNTFSAGFPFDNAFLILTDPRVHSFGLHNLKEILTHDYWWHEYASGLYRPITTLSYLFNYVAPGGGDRPFAYHCVNLLLHAANAFLVYLLVLRVAKRYWPAVFAAILWTVHPIATEAVTNIVGRADELAALGLLGALLLHIRSTEETGRKKIACLAGMAVFTTLAIFSKESGVMAGGVVLLYDVAWRIPRGSSLRVAAGHLRRFFREGYLYWALPTLAMFAARWAVFRHTNPIEIAFLENPLLGSGLATRLGTVMRATGEYLWLLLWPQKLSADYSYNQVPLFDWRSATWPDAAAAAALVALLLIAWRSYRGGRVAFFLIGFAALTYLPASNLLFTSGTIMAERLLYLPAVAFAAAVAIGAERLTARLGLQPKAAAVVLCLLAVAYGVRTYRRNFDWQNDATLFASAVEASPGSFRAHMALADALFARDPKFAGGERAIEEAEKGAAIADSVPDARNSAKIYARLAALYGARGDSLGGAAPEWYRKAVAAGLRGVAIDRLQKESRRSPDLYQNLGIAYWRLGAITNARDAFRYERRLNPRRLPVYTRLAAVYQALNQPEEAAAALLESLLLDDSQAPALAALATLYAGIDGGSCAIVNRELNRDCPLVRRDLCSAYRELARDFPGVGDDHAAESFRQAAARIPGCR